MHGSLAKPVCLYLAAAAVCLLSSTANAGALSEQDRIRSHLRLVEDLLRYRPADGLTDRQRENRNRGLDVLNDYWRRGEFPRNTHHPRERHPYFIDHSGVPCAVGQLMLKLDGKALALKIAETQNYKYLDEMDGDDIATWVNNSGFTFDELRLIQPTYEYMTQYQDPILEAAFLVDQDTFVRLLASSGLQPGSVPYKKKINDALRALAPIANWDTKRHPSNERYDISSEPPPRRSNGKTFVKYLLELGADPAIRRTDSQPFSLRPRISEFDSSLLKAEAS